MSEPKPAPTPAIVVKIYQPLEVRMTEFVAQFHQDGLSQTLDLLASKGVSEIDVWMPQKLIWDTRDATTSTSQMHDNAPAPQFSVEEEMCLIHVSPKMSDALAKHFWRLRNGLDVE
ncbi:uncharacterized protein UTRI_05896_B [Ustilago trichophora]|uniref:Uncharacterized protein n=1 Tax=Ustilago trichophora TaxID=86804 RepID=A0A5C3EKY6_9BASI|nr:uncharacterized protein UTRI_05896_B [Ustilago trichophora]